MQDDLRPESFGVRVAARVCGYTRVTGWPREWRFLPPVSFTLSLIIVFAATLTGSSTEPPTPTGPPRVLTRLDGFTRSRDPRTTNAIPEFLSLPGTLGALVNDGTITPVDESELSKGFCTPTLALLIRQRFPGVYDGMPDAELERRVLEKFPEYQEERCALPAWIGAASSEIVKYELEPLAVATSRASAILRALLFTALFGVATLNVYYRIAAPLGASLSS